MDYLAHAEIACPLFRYIIKPGYWNFFFFHTVIKDAKEQFPPFENVSLVAREHRRGGAEQGSFLLLVTRGVAADPL